MPDIHPALAISALAHAGALVVLGLASGDERRVEAPPDETPRVAIDIPVDVEVHAPIDVALVPATSIGGGSPTARGGASSTRGRDTTRANASVATTSASGGEAHTTTGRDGATGTGRDYMKMRGPDLGLPGEVAARIAEGGTTPPPPIVPSGKLKPGPGGTAVIRDAVATVDVHRDGTVTMHHAPDFEIHFKLPKLSLSKWRQQIAESIDDWYKDAYAQARAGRSQDLPRHEQAVPGACDHYDDLCGVGANGTSAPSDEDDGLFFIEGKADVVSWLAKKTGVGDLYASRKRKLLDDTRDERVSRGGAYRAEQLDRSAEMMRANLERLWASTRDPAARRHALFELWDECGEGDGPLGEAGQRARAQVIGWIAAHLPAGGPGAFTPDEIASFDARRSSKQHFAPY